MNESELDRFLEAAIGAGYSLPESRLVEIAVRVQREAEAETLWRVFRDVMVQARASSKRAVHRTAFARSIS